VTSCIFEFLLNIPLEQRLLQKKSITIMSGSMQSNVGNRQVYNDGDQRYVFFDVYISSIPTSHLLRPSNASEEQERYNVGSERAHIDLDSKLVCHHLSLKLYLMQNILFTRDERTLSNRLAAASQAEREPEKPSLSQVDPTLPARNHGNDPSRGAEIDKQLMEEEKEELERKGRA
jgi:hypothetical protein